MEIRKDSGKDFKMKISEIIPYILNEDLEDWITFQELLKNLYLYLLKYLDLSQIYKRNRLYQLQIKEI